MKKIFIILVFLLSSSANAYAERWFVYSIYSKTDGGLTGGTNALKTSVNVNTCDSSISGVALVNYPANTRVYTIKILRTEYNDGVASEPNIAAIYYSCIDDFALINVGDCVPLEPCDTEKDNLRAACGGDSNVDWSSWNDATCSGGECKNKCDGSGEETPAEAMARCAALEKIYSHYDYTICRGICGCSESQYNDGKESCGVYGIKDFNEITCQPICNGCEDKWNEAQALCGNKFVESWDCDNATGKITNLKCMGEPPKAIPGEDGTPAAPDPTAAPDDKDPEPDTPDNPDDPSDAKLAAIHGELQKVVLQNNDRKNQLNEATNSLNWIGENNRRIANNTKIIGDSISGIGNDISSGIKGGLSSLEGSIKSVGNDIDQLTTAVNDISAGDYTSPADEEVYASEAHDFSERTTEFLSQMKTTGMFSLPGMLSDSIPGGGSSTLNIETGETFGGTHTIDFNNFLLALTILRCVFQISGMFGAIKIVTLKR